MAANRLDDPTDVESVARLYEIAAGELEQAVAVADERLRSQRFSSARSAGLVNAAAGRRREAVARAEELRDMARSLRNHATWIEDTSLEVKRLEQRIRAWAAANPILPASGGLDASLVTAFPDPGSLEWRDLADLLRRQGATF